MIERESRLSQSNWDIGDALTSGGLSSLLSFPLAPSTPSPPPPCVSCPRRICRSARLPVDRGGRFGRTVFVAFRNNPRRAMTDMISGAAATLAKVHELRSASSRKERKVRG